MNINRIIIALFFLSSLAECQITLLPLQNGNFDNPDPYHPNEPTHISLIPPDWEIVNGTSDWIGPLVTKNEPTCNLYTPYQSQKYLGNLELESIYQTLSSEGFGYSFVKISSMLRDSKPCLYDHIPLQTSPKYPAFYLTKEFNKQFRPFFLPNKFCFETGMCEVMDNGLSPGYKAPCVVLKERIDNNTLASTIALVNGFDVSSPWFKHESGWSFLTDEKIDGANNLFFIISGGDYCKRSEIKDMWAPTLPYSLFDDVRLEKISLCQQPCGRALEPFGSISPPNVFTPNGDGYNDYWAVPVNALSYDLEVFSRYGNSIYKLSDEVIKKHPVTGEPCVFWNGRRKNGNLVVSGLYNYVLTVKNCSGSSIPIQGNILVLDSRQLHSFAPDYDFPYAEWVCCSEEYYIENQFFTSGINYSAALTVTAVNTTAPNELTVEFTAGDEVVLGPGFVAEYGSDFRAWIEGCSPLLGKTSFDGNSSTFLPDTSIQNDPALQGIDLSKIGEPDAFLTIPEIRIYPNPFGETLTVDLEGVWGDNLSVELYDINMRAVCQPYHLGPLDTDIATITLSTSNIPSGIYLVVLKRGNEKLAIKKAVKYSN